MATLPAPCRVPVRFMLEVEISTIYKKGDRTRKIHHLIYAPDFETVDRMSARLARIGNIASDGRPILGLDSRNLLEIALESGPHAYLVPAHIWTPWFAALGSQSGFDSIADCYGDLADHIFAVETGLSSDPPMNWRISFLDRYRLTSNSDAHSPGKLGREATTFDCDLDYFAIKTRIGDRPRLCGHGRILSGRGQISPRRPSQMRGAAQSQGDARARRTLPGLRRAGDDRRRAPGRGAGRPQRGAGGAAADRRRGVEPGAAAGNSLRARRQRSGVAKGRAQLRSGDRQARRRACDPAGGPGRGHRPRRLLAAGRGDHAPARRTGDPRSWLRRRIRRHSPVRGQRAEAADRGRRAVRRAGDETDEGRRRQAEDRP